MIGQEIIHEATQAIYLNENAEILPDSAEYNEFQTAENPSSLGYKFVETVEQREKAIAELEESLNPPTKP